MSGPKHVETSDGVVTRNCIVINVETCLDYDLTVGHEFERFWTDCDLYLSFLYAWRFHVFTMTFLMNP